MVLMGQSIIKVNFEKLDSNEYVFKMMEIEAYCEKKIPKIKKIKVKFCFRTRRRKHLLAFRSGHHKFQKNG